MDVSTLTKAQQVASVPPAVAKVNASSVEVNKPATQGNSLPDLGQVDAHSKNPSTTESTSQLNSKELHNLVEQANVTLQGRFSDLKFTVAEGTDITVVRIEDSETGELIRQFPSEAMIAIAQALEEIQSGMMLKEKA